LANLQCVNTVYMYQVRQNTCFASSVYKGFTGDFVGRTTMSAEYTRKNSHKLFYMHV